MIIERLCPLYSTDSTRGIFSLTLLSTLHLELGEVAVAGDLLTDADHGLHLPRGAEDRVDQSTGESRGVCRSLLGPVTGGGT